MIPAKIFTSCTEFQGIISVNDFRLPIGLQELLQASLGFLWSLCFARIWLDPLGGQVLYHDCISVIGSRFTTFTENLVICCYQVNKIYSSRYGFAIASSAWCPRNFGPFTDLAISVFREMSINTVSTPNPHVSFRLALKRLHEMNWRERLPVMEFHHPPNSPWILAAIPESQNCLNTTGLPVLSWSLFYWFWDFVGLGFIRLPWSIINRIRHWHCNQIVVYSMICTQQVRKFDSWRVSRFTTGCPVPSWLLSRFTTGCPVLSCSSCFFKMATTLLSSFFFGPFTRLVINLTMCTRALFPKSATTLGLGGCHFSQNELVLVPLR